MVVLGALRQHKYYFIAIYEEEAITTLKAIVKQVTRGLQGMLVENLSTSELYIYHTLSSLNNLK